MTNIHHSPSDRWHHQQLRPYARWRPCARRGAPDGVRLREPRDARDQLVVETVFGSEFAYFLLNKSSFCSELALNLREIQVGDGHVVMVTIQDGYTGKWELGHKFVEFMVWIVIFLFV